MFPLALGQFLFISRSTQAGELLRQREALPGRPGEAASRNGLLFPRIPQQLTGRFIQCRELLFCHATAARVALKKSAPSSIAGFSRRVPHLDLNAVCARQALGEAFGEIDGPARHEDRRTKRSKVSDSSW